MAYVTVDELAKILGAGADLDRAQTAADAATDWITATTGRAWGASDPFAGPVPARIHQLAMNAALRFYHDPEAPYGVLGGANDVPMYMRSLMTDAGPLLLGLRTDFGIG